jgi:putative ABC transport system ATP-binding protein
MSEGRRGHPAIEVREATRVYPGPVEALRGVDLTVDYGETVAITGPSGCGKSSLLHLLAAIDSPTSGSVVVGGRDLAHIRDLSEYRRQEVGLVFQFHNLLPQLPAHLNVELPMFGTHRTARERKTRAASLLVDVGLPDCGDRLPTELSGGERQRVAIARALANEPEILLADEPTGSLDSASTEHFLKLLDRLGAAGMTIVVVTHDLGVAAHAHRTVAMRDGRVVDEQRSDPDQAASSEDTSPVNAPPEAAASTPDQAAHP